MAGTRPEYAAPPEIFYNEAEAVKYTRNTRMLKIQGIITERALELLNLPAGFPAMILDIGCGSALSGSIISEAGHGWVGMDISPDMLDVAVDREVEGDVIQADMGQGIAFRPGLFDGAISISALQWLFYPSKRCHSPYKRLQALFSQLYSSLYRGARAVFQFYPESTVQMNMAVQAAMACGFTGGVVVDYPDSTKAKKYYLTLTAGTNHTYLAPKMSEGVAQGGQQQHIQYESRREKNAKRGKKQVRCALKSRDWIQQKKDRQERQGKTVRHDSKYTGRRRPARF
jgi:18S rRNA (guanine1575-N7)-methyltransferase|eukprot:Stramenopile-MAST_4_protein_5394